MDFLGKPEKQAEVDDDDYQLSILEAVSYNIPDRCPRGLHHLYGSLLLFSRYSEGAFPRSVSALS